MCVEKKKMLNLLHEAMSVCRQKWESNWKINPQSQVKQIWFYKDWKNVWDFMFVSLYLRLSFIRNDKGIGLHVQLKKL